MNSEFSNNENISNNVEVDFIIDENSLRKSIVSEKLLVKEKRNKRKSKIFTENDNSVVSKKKFIDDQYENFYSRNLFKESNMDFQYNSSHQFTLEAFADMSIKDDNEKLKNLNQIIKDLNEDNDLDENKKLSYSKRFRDRMEYHPTKRLKI